MTVRLNRLMAERGLGARRKCDTLIEQGQVRVNGALVTTPGVRVDPQRDRVTVGGRPLPAAARPRYLMLNKPAGVITTLSDPEGRRTVAEFLPAGARLFPVGRLDAGTTGLLLLTNDGDLAHHLMHPRYGVEKFYRVLLASPPNPQQLARLQRGVRYDPGMRSAPARVRVRDRIARGHVMEIALHEGRYRQVRRMCEAVGLEVLALHRWGYGPLRLGELERGMWRELSAEEVQRLRAGSARPSGSGPRAREPRRRPRLLAGGTGFGARPPRGRPGPPPAGPNKPAPPGRREPPGPRRGRDRPVEPRGPRERTRGGFGTERGPRERTRGGFGTERGPRERARGGFGTERGPRGRRGPFAEAGPEVRRPPGSPKRRPRPATGPGAGGSWTRPPREGGRREGSPETRPDLRGRDRREGRNPRRRGGDSASGGWSRHPGVRGGGRRGPARGPRRPRPKG